MQRRTFLLSSLLAAVAVKLAKASPIDPNQTFILQREDIKFMPVTGLPPASGEMAKLYGDLNEPGPLSGADAMESRLVPAHLIATPPIGSKSWFPAHGGWIAVLISHRKWQCPCLRAATSNERHAHFTMMECLRESKNRLLCRFLESVRLISSLPIQSCRRGDTLARINGRKMSATRD